MTEEAQGAVVAEEKKTSKTQELRDWLDEEIGRVKIDLDTLGLALSGPPRGRFLLDESHAGGFVGRYANLTSDEREVKIAEDRKKLEKLQKRLELLRSARELDIDIDAMERAIPGLLITVRNYSRYGFPLIEGEMQASCLFLKGFTMPLGPLELRVNVAERPIFAFDFRFVNIQTIESRDFSFEPSSGYTFGYICWHFLFQDVEIKARSAPGSKDTEVKLSITPIASSAST